ncbi:uncharacterized protein DUF3891 [Melghirimyces profundicolus]|uniref:Uncharacterized protein DUF3891 n=1 Tax=Melghirimyces profundicolus TaxID=1242148 RepID=A0A2T6C7Q4_9BACL|nr:DUF3891 family protein [Melghirimyces profundicolus]PTX64348.1 uncharacterized protein DUF3891 [Melghirimyces profundicolus]
MIVREEKDRYILIRQHDHGRVSGDIADHWKETPDASTRTAVRYHDVGWEELDRSVRWNPKTGKPYSFVDHPMEDKIRAYHSGVNRVEEMDGWAACLCSMHYVSFFSKPREEAAVRFVERETERQRRWTGGTGEADRRKLEERLRFLKLCDDLSLFLCLNSPGKNEHPWYRAGFRSGSERFLPRWEETDLLRLEPLPFFVTFEVVLPYQEISFSGKPLKEGVHRIRVAGED